MNAKISVLYFCADSTPTAEEVAEARALGITAFRNGRLAEGEDSIEKVEAVAGRVPRRYAKLKGVKVIPSKLGDASK